jgi:hypothetical protein
LSIRYFALTLGILFLLIGIAAFVPGLVAMDGHDLRVHGPGTGYLLGLFHVNVLHNLVHLLFGVWGIAAYRRLDASRLYARAVAVSYLVLAVIGIVPNAQINTLFGLVPIHGHDVWLHLVIAAAAAYFGWARVPETRDDSLSGSATDLR